MIVKINNKMEEVQEEDSLLLVHAVVCYIATMVSSRKVLVQHMEMVGELYHLNLFPVKARCYANY